MSDLGQAADPAGGERRSTRRAREQRRRLATATTDLGVPEQPATSVPTALAGRWNILDRGVRPLVVRTDGTFTLVDHRDGRTDGRWLRVSDTFVSLFLDGTKRHSLYAMPDGQVFLSRYVAPGSVSTPELAFRSVLSFEGTWESPYRASQYTPAPPTQVSVGADRTFCADLDRRQEGGSVVVWSGIWVRAGAASAVLDYVEWQVTDGARRMASHGQTTLTLHEDGTMTISALDDVFYPAPGTVRAEGDKPLSTAEEPAVLLCPLAVDDPPEADEPDLDEAARDDGQDEARRDVSTVELPAVDPGSRRPASRRDAVVTAEVPDEPVDGVLSVSRRDVVVTAEVPDEPVGEVRCSPSPRDVVVTAELPSDGPAGTEVRPPASRRDAVVTAELPLGDRST